MTSIQEKFLALLRFSIGTRQVIPVLTFADLKAIYHIAAKQTMTGVLLDGVKKVPVTRLKDGEEVPACGKGIFVRQDETSAYEEFIMTWVGKGVSIAKRNTKLDKDVGLVFEQLHRDGFEACLLKGQGNARMYPNPSARTSGDIDVWCRPRREEDDFRKGMISDEDVRAVISYVRRKSKKARAIYHHVDGLRCDGVEVEAHYRPHYMLNFRYNRMLQQYFAEHAEEQFHHTVEIGGNAVAVPTVEFNIVFQLSHIYQHLFHEGIGMRQIVDYYYLVASPLTSPPNGRGIIEVEHYSGGKPMADTLRWLGLEKIGGAVMWILVNVLGMDERLAIIEPDERRGRFVLNEILEGGNFGKFDQRAMSGTYASPLKANIQRLVRDARLLRYFHSEALWEPWFRTWHFFWRWRHR